MPAKIQRKNMPSEWSRGPCRALSHQLLRILRSYNALQKRILEFLPGLSQELAMKPPPAPGSHGELSAVAPRTRTPWRISS